MLKETWAALAEEVLTDTLEYRIDGVLPPRKACEELLDSWSECFDDSKEEKEIRKSAIRQVLASIRN